MQENTSPLTPPPLPGSNKRDPLNMYSRTINIVSIDQKHKYKTLADAWHKRQRQIDALQPKAAAQHSQSGGLSATTD